MEVYEDQKIILESSAIENTFVDYIDNFKANLKETQQPLMEKLSDGRSSTLVKLQAIDEFNNRDERVRFEIQSYFVFLKFMASVKLLSVNTTKLQSTDPENPVMRSIDASIKALGLLKMDSRTDYMKVIKDELNKFKKLVD